jgi:hypothetical protein
MKQAERITNAIIEFVYGEQPWISGTHPLRKSPCFYCKTTVCERDMQAHLEMHEAPEPDEQPELPEEHDEEPSTPAIAVKGYVGSLDAWFDELFGIGPELREDEFWKKCRNAVKAKCIESFRNGKLAART